MTDTAQYSKRFYSLISHKESETVEFKRAENSFDFDDLGKYFSALSNEANLRGHECGWLIFGYDEKKQTIVGTSYKDGESALNKLKQDFSQHTTDGQTFRDIIPIKIDGKRILMFMIPAAPRNIVMKWKGIAYGRDGESLKPLNQSKMDEIRHQAPEPDWSAEIVPNATIDDLDEVAIAKARMMFKKVHSRIPAEEVNKMFTEQMERRFPMPDYEIDNEKKEVAVRIYGNAINERYTKLLKDNDTLTLHDCISLDAIQKGHRIDEEIAQDLLKRGLIEGEAPNYTISLGVAKASKQLPGYTKVKGLERDKIKQMVLQYIQNAGSDGAKRESIMEYLEGTLPNRNTQAQNQTLVKHIFAEMKESELIYSRGKLWFENKGQ